MLKMVSKVNKGIKYIRKNPNYIRKSRKHVKDGLKISENVTERLSLKYIKNLLKQFHKCLKVFRKSFKDINEGFNRDKGSQIPQAQFKIHLEGSQKCPKDFQTSQDEFQKVRKGVKSRSLSQC